MNFIDDQINVQDYNNVQSRKTGGQQQSYSRQNPSTQGSSNANPARISKTSLDQNFLYQSGDANTRKSSKSNKLRQSQGMAGQRQMYTQLASGTSNGVPANGQFVPTQQDLVNYKNGTSPNTSVNFFKGNT